MPEEKDISRELRSFGPRIIDILDSVDFWDMGGEYDPLEIDTAIKSQPEYKRYVTESKEKNSRVWDLVKALFIPAAIGVGIATIQRDYKPQIARQVAKEDKPKLTTQDFIKGYYDEHGLEFVKQMTQTDKNKLKSFIWANAGNNERPFAKLVLKEPNLRYITDLNEVRLRNIKRTEIHRCTSYGSWKFAEYNDFKKKEWRTAGDHRVRPSHRAINGETAPISDAFSNGYMFPQEIGCRCFLIYMF